MVLKILQMIIILKILMIIFNGYLQNTSLYKCHLYNHSYSLFSVFHWFWTCCEIPAYLIPHSGQNDTNKFAPPIHGFCIHEFNQLWTGNCIFNPWLGIRRCWGLIICIVLCHFTLGTWASTDLGNHTGPLRNNCTQKLKLYKYYLIYIMRINELLILLTTENNKH